MRICSVLHLLFLSGSVSAAPIARSDISNPFEGHPWYVNPAYQQELDISIKHAAGKVKKTLQSMRELPSAYWIDNKSKIQGKNTSTLEGILEDAVKQSPVPLVVVMLYDLPNRDCDAKASNGEICCYKNMDGSCDYSKAGDCKDGLAEYQSEYVDPFANVLKQYHKRVQIVVVVEPDSLPNLATNSGNPHCGNSATSTAYTKGVAYAVNTISQQAPSVALYLDAAHGGWLGWKDNAQSFVNVIKQMGIASKLRGFSSNVANYQALGTPCPSSAFDNQLPLYCQQNSSDACCQDPCKLLSQWNSGNNELNYVQMMSKMMSNSIAGFAPRWIIDTGRNGVEAERSDCSNWCNIRGAGIGHRPTIDTPLPKLVDSFFWLKTPGESDGCTQTLPSGEQCARFDSMCASSDSIGTKPGEPNAPEAGKWFDYQIQSLAANAKMGPPPGPVPGPGPPTPPVPPPPPPPIPSGCPSGNLTECIQQCPVDHFVDCMNDCIANCPHSPSKMLKPYERCGGASFCVAGYECSQPPQLRCMPTPTKLEQAKHSSVFATSYAHARAASASKAWEWPVLSR